MTMGTEHIFSPRRMPPWSGRGRPRGNFLLCGAGSLLAGILLLAGEAAAVTPFHCRGIEVRPHAGYTRLLLKLDGTPDYQTAAISPQAVRLILPQTVAPPLKKLRSYRDRNIRAISLVPRDGDLHLTVTLDSPGNGFRLVHIPGVPTLALDFGPSLRAAGVIGRAAAPPGREGIWSGAPQLISQYEPPLHAGIPFVPTDRPFLQKYLAESELKLFQDGEAALYKGKAAAAEQVFASFCGTASPIQPLASYRLGEARYLLQNYAGALAAFRDGERQWPEYLVYNHGAAFAYADSVIRSGDYAQGRQQLQRLAAVAADRPYAPLLAVRLADILVRQQQGADAEAIYRTVSERFPATAAAGYAALRLADRRIFTRDGDTYRQLQADYARITAAAGEFPLRQEAAFREALVAALYGPAQPGLELVARYERRYPRGVYAGVSRAMREELLPQVARELYADRDLVGLVRLAQENRDYLAGCLADNSFLPRLAEGFVAGGQIKGEIGLFGSLLERPWAQERLPFLLWRILEDAQALGDTPLAEAAAQRFLEKFPHHADAGRVREQLAAICYRRHDLPAVARELDWLLDGRQPAAQAESYYYLGKALVQQGNQRGAERAMTLYAAAMQSRGERSPLQADACFVSGCARLALGDRAGSLAALRAGLSQAAPERRDQFTYKIGEVHAAEGRLAEARSTWEALAREGSDPEWRKLANLALADLEWRTVKDAELSRLSKK